MKDYRQRVDDYCDQLHRKAWETARKKGLIPKTPTRKGSFRLLLRNLRKASEKRF